MEIEKRKKEKAVRLLHSRSQRLGIWHGDVLCVLVLCAVFCGFESMRLLCVPDVCMYASCVCVCFGETDCGTAIPSISASALYSNSDTICCCRIVTVNSSVHLS